MLIQRKQLCFIALYATACVILNVVSACGSELERGSGKYNLVRRQGKDGAYHWSQYHQDEFVDGYFKGKRRGFFVEIGGFDGESHSNTLFLEHQRKWDGLLIEPNPHAYRMLRAKSRPCYSANACISDSHEELTFRVAGGITSSLELMTDKHARRIESDSRVYAHQTNWKGTGEEVTVQCRTLEHYLNQLNVSHIDYFSLDVEGAELHILESLDWSSLDITLFTIETQEQQAHIHAFMVRKGYHRIKKLGQDYVFVKREN